MVSVFISPFAIQLLAILSLFLFLFLLKEMSQWNFALIIFIHYDTGPFCLWIRSFATVNLVLYCFILDQKFLKIRFSLLNKVNLFMTNYSYVLFWFRSATLSIIWINIFSYCGVRFSTSIPFLRYGLSGWYLLIVH